MTRDQSSATAVWILAGSLFLGFLVVIGFVLPLTVCPACNGVTYLDPKEVSSCTNLRGYQKPYSVPVCTYCKERKRVPPFKRWTYLAPPISVDSVSLW